MATALKSFKASRTYLQFVISLAVAERVYQRTQLI